MTVQKPLIPFRLITREGKGKKVGRIVWLSFPFDSRGKKAIQLNSDREFAERSGTDALAFVPVLKKERGDMLLHAALTPDARFHSSPFSLHERSKGAGGERFLVYSCRR